MNKRSASLKTKFNILKGNGYIEKRGLPWLKKNHREVYEYAKKVKMI